MKLNEQLSVTAFFYFTHIHSSLFSKNVPKLCRLDISPVYKKSRFPLNMLIFMQKGLRFSGLIVKLMGLH